jgi:uncharacterized protein
MKSNLRNTGFILLLFSQFCLADIFLSSETKALIEKADAGDVKAQFLVGSAYDTGKGAPRDGEKAMKYYLLAANQGDAEAQNSVGSGLQAEKKYSEALSWYQRAAENNHPLALNNLAYLYDLGLGVTQDRAKAFELYSRSANLGWAHAMWNVANMYGAGQVGPKDLVSACIWSFRAKKYATTDNAALLNQLNRVGPYLQKSLSPEEYSKCQTESAAWAPNQSSQ